MRSISVLVVALALALAPAPTLSLTSDPPSSLASRDVAAWEQFVEYALDYQKPYRSHPNTHPLVLRRFQAFSQNLDRIEKHNAQYASGDVTFELGVNDLADLSDAEYRARLSYRFRPHPAPSTFSGLNPGSDPLPDAFDWREKDAVTPVKNQGQCGSCWAFSAVAAMEGAYAVHTGHLQSFSEQEIVDCTRNGTYTCTTGGEMQAAYVEVIQNHGGRLEPEAAYPYTAQSKGICRADDSKGLGTFTSYANVTSGDEAALKAAIVAHGVQSVAIDASSFTFQLYRHGVYSWPMCHNLPEDLDHGVATVGYGVYKKKPFWLVKNSWGEGWGMHGYIMMSRDKKNQCGIATDASYPILGGKVEDEKMNRVHNQDFESDNEFMSIM